jgi:hypothetical protein
LVTAKLQVMPAPQLVEKNVHWGTQTPSGGVRPETPAHWRPPGQSAAVRQNLRHARGEESGTPIPEQKSPGAQSSCPTPSGPSSTVRAQECPAATCPVGVKQPVLQTSFPVTTSVHLGVAGSGQSWVTVSQPVEQRSSQEDEVPQAKWKLRPSTHPQVPATPLGSSEQPGLSGWSGRHHQLLPVQDRLAQISPAQVTGEKPLKQPQVLFPLHWELSGQV